MTLSCKLFHYDFPAFEIVLAFFWRIFLVLSFFKALYDNHLISGSIYRFFFVVGNSQVQKHPREVFYNKRCSLKFREIHRKTWNFIKKKTLAQVFSCEFCKTFKNTFLQNTSGGSFSNCSFFFCDLKAKPLQTFMSHLRFYVVMITKWWSMHVTQMSASA